jgi:hypothetical protein
MNGLETRFLYFKGTTFPADRQSPKYINMDFVTKVVTLQF